MKTPHNPAFFSLPMGGDCKRAKIDLQNGGQKLVIMSDFHMGSGRNDDFERNGALLMDILSGYYLENGYTLVLNGDIEELLKANLGAVREKWGAVYEIFDAFSKAGRLYKILGNHDAALVFEKRYPYPLYEVVRVDNSHIPVFIYHGHQGSRFYSAYSKQIAAAVRFILKPLGIGNITSARSPFKRFVVEKRAYDFSSGAGVLSIIGHTHRALFESLGRYEFIRFEIEQHCRDFLHADDEQKKVIKTKVASLIVDLEKVRKKEKKAFLRTSLYGGDIVVPCLFNSGSVIGRKGINAIELDDASISLVYWWEDGKGKRFITRQGYEAEAGISPRGAEHICKKVTLNTEKLENISARVELLGR